jgi:hypothetical protein
MRNGRLYLCCGGKVGDLPPLRFVGDVGADRENIRPQVGLQAVSAAERGGGTVGTSQAHLD